MFDKPTFLLKTISKKLVFWFLRGRFSEALAKGGICGVAWSRGCGVAVSHGRSVAMSQCCSVAGTGVVCVEMFFAGPAFRIVNSQIVKKSLWIWIFCRLQAMCCFANSHYAKKLRQMGSVLQNFRHIEVSWLLNMTVLLFAGEWIGGSEGILKQISSCSSHLVP